MSSLYFNNAMCWAQIRLAGGWKKIATTTTFVAGLAAASTIVVLYYSNLVGPKGFPLAGNAPLIGIQILLLFLVGYMRVGRAIRRDLSSRLMESHRLMPLTGRQAIFGYIAGSVTPILSLVGVFFLIGIWFYLNLSLPLSHWVLSHVILLCLATTLWAFAAVSAFSAPGLAFMIVVILFFNSTDSPIASLLPGFLLFCTPFHGRTIFVISALGSRLTEPLAVGIAVQGCLCLLCLHGATRKYNRPGCLAFPVPSTLALLALWVCASIYGMYHYHEVVPQFLARTWDNPSILGSLYGGLVFSLLVLSSTTWSQLMKASGAPIAPRWAVPAPVSILACLIVLAPLVYIWPPSVLRTDDIMVLLLCALSLSEAYLLMRILGYFPKSFSGLIPLLAILWLGPVLVNAIYSSINQPNAHMRMGTTAMLSPLATIWSFYFHNNRPAWKNEIFKGLDWQMGILAVLLIGYLRVRNRRPKFG